MKTVYDLIRRRTPLEVICGNCDNSRVFNHRFLMSQFGGGQISGGAEVFAGAPAPGAIGCGSLPTAWANKSAQDAALRPVGEISRLGAAGDMCGRFTQRYTWSAGASVPSRIRTGANLQPHYNIAPTMTVDVIRLDKDGKRELVPMRWGLIPAWWAKSLKKFPRRSMPARNPSPTGRRSATPLRAALIIPASGFTSGPATRATSNRTALSS